jgi:molybdate transport system substrate-binding protein
MKKRKIFTFIISAVFSSLLVVACTQVTNKTSSVASNSAAQSTNLTISAAASLKDALVEIKPLYRQQKSNVGLAYNLGASGALQQQIEQGAPVDVFISAAPKQMDALQQKGLLLDGTRKDLLKNQLVLIVPKDATGISDFKDLASDRIKKIALGEPKSVPAGKYAEEVLTSQKILDKVKTKAVLAKDVRQVLNYVETGNTDAGIVYLSDAKSSDKVKVVATASEQSHAPVVYPIAILKNSKNVDAAKEFVQFLSSDTAKIVFEKQGFTVAPQ